MSFDGGLLAFMRRARKNLGVRIQRCGLPNWPGPGIVGILLSSSGIVNISVNNTKKVLKNTKKIPSMDQGSLVNNQGSRELLTFLHTPMGQIYISSAAAAGRSRLRQ
ncbi:hypothetical protein IMZ48_05370 [Candidatus Bathyarchaeota archaeon]|nr:hypothetical protein [Candidatus Bathyarchaeota archaeon]